jgi:hypothetical protein
MLVLVTILRIKEDDVSVRGMGHLVGSAVG